MPKQRKKNTNWKTVKFVRCTFQRIAAVALFVPAVVKTRQLKPDSLF